MHAHRGERKENLFMLAKYLIIAVQVLHLTEHGFYDMHTDVWLTSFSSKMFIYAFLLWFFSHSHQKEW